MVQRRINNRIRADLLDIELNISDNLKLSLNILYKNNKVVIINIQFQKILLCSDIPKDAINGTLNKVDVISLIRFIISINKIHAMNMY